MSAWRALLATPAGILPAPAQPVTHLDADVLRVRSTGPSRVRLRPAHGLGGGGGGSATGAGTPTVIGVAVLARTTTTPSEFYCKYLSL